MGYCFFLDISISNHMYLHWFHLSLTLTSLLPGKYTFVPTAPCSVIGLTKSEEPDEKRWMRFNTHDLPVNVHNLYVLF